MASLFAVPECPPIEASKIPPRPYQLEALEALDDHLRTKDTNPCVVIPTGGGKSLLIAWTIQRWKREYPGLRVMVLAHRKELVQQNAEELRGLWPGGDIGIYAAGLRQRDVESSILFASIDSVYNKWGNFPPFDLLIVDEAHRIPAKGEGKYLTFVKGCKLTSKRLRVIGFTATPYRMGMGPICHKDHLLNEVCYEAFIGDLIRDGYLCRLRSRVGDGLPDLSGVKRNGAGDYVATSLAEAMDRADVVQLAVREAMAAIMAEKRKSIVFFCVDHDHCRRVSLELRRYGIEAPMVTSETPSHERDRHVENFKRGYVRALCNVNVYTEGFNAKRVDCVVLLRPTLSAGLYAQMVGRGLRLHESKEDCLVLDYARCIETHGPVDCLVTGDVRTIRCGSVAWKVEEGQEQPPSCGDTFSRVLGACPHCGWVIPPQEVARAEAEEAAAAERKLHEAEASRRAILGSEPEELKVDGVSVARWRKQGSPDSVAVQYRCGISTFREWICLDHPGFAGRKARQWWTRRFGVEAARAATVDSVVDDLFVEATAKAIAGVTETITVIRRGKQHEIVGHKLRLKKPVGADPE